VQFYNNSKGRYVLTDNALRVIKKLSWFIKYVGERKNG
jgi:hypothetical protein